MQTTRGADSLDATHALFLDVGGVFGFGARPSVEVGEVHAVVARLQLMNTGGLSYAVEPLNEFQRFEWGFGTSLGYRRYETGFGNLRGFYFGGGLGASMLRLVDERQDQIAITAIYLSPYGEFGYRWVFGQFLVGFGPSLGFRFPISSEVEPLGTASCQWSDSCGASTNGRVEGMMVVDMGWVL